MREFRKSHKLDNVCYDIRGPVMEEAEKLQAEGASILKLNIGNTATFGLYTPDEVVHDMIMNLRDAEGYCDSRGIFAARKAVMHNCQQKNIRGVDVDDIYIGNGVSELISMSMNGLLDDGDEVLIPAPDYPLWTASVTLSGGTPVHYICDEESDWYPDLDDMESKISSRTKAVVIISPNNPTGAVYPPDVLRGIIDLAVKHELIVFSDEIYDKIIYDQDFYVSPASLSDEVMFITFGGLSKVYRAPGFRAGWMILSGNKSAARDYIEGLNILSNMRLCSNVPSQFAIQTSLGGYQSITELIVPGGRLYEQREAAWSLLNEIPGISCVKPAGALYCFPKVDIRRFGIEDDVQFVLDFLRAKHILLVQGTGFNWKSPDHFRLVFLPVVEELERAAENLKDFLSVYKQGE
ncbi:MAG: pyridoxal phosphate-dependent aminotransferase [Spirochaetales bacterium]|uniref:alanine transaminase n=1 Tax=Candidatus Thalassospirochaeta sargassi TaxID=3119039 RepID=A0AAJ1I9Q5_9SPIO|nr:pyridoxal phosphate-dependent aminotransferase [Spirochaetales bacterium]